MFDIDKVQCYNKKLDWQKPVKQPGVDEHMKIVVLMYTFNGVDYLGEQLQSIFKQDILDKAEIKILVRDDGSTDRTTDILDKYKNEGKLSWSGGETKGKTKCFWELMEKAEDADYYAFCEQDDVWYPEKLSRAIKYLQTKAILEGEETEVSDRALLYYSGCTVTNAKLKPVHFKRNPANKYTDFEHSLIYSSMPGCTYVFNGNAKKNLLKYNLDLHFAGRYEDLVRNIISITGSVVYDRVPTVYLRRTGADKPGPAYQGGTIGQLKQKFSLMTGKGINVKSKTAKALLEVFGEEVEGTSMAESLKQVATYADDVAQRDKLLQNTKFMTNSYNDKWFVSAVKAKKL